MKHLDAPDDAISTVGSGGNTMFPVDFKLFLMINDWLSSFFV